MRISVLGCLLLLVPCGVYAQVAPPAQIFDAARLAQAATQYKAEIIDDAQAHNGKAVRFTGKAGYLAWYPGTPLAPGKYRFTVRLRLPQGGRFVIPFDLTGQDYHDLTTLDFGVIPADGSYVERSVELYLPADVQSKNWDFSLFNSLPPELIIDDVTITPVLDASPVELLGVQAGKLVYAPQEAGTATVFLLNYTDQAQTVHLRLVVESGLHDTQVLREQDVTVPAGQPVGTQLQRVPVPLSALPEWGHTLRVEMLLNGKVASASSDTFAVSAHPQLVGQYGIFGGGEDYVATNAADNVRAFRNAFQTFVEVCFWAPSDMDQLVPSPGKDRWWSGQTLAKLSTAQMQAYINACHAQGISVLGYADYSAVFGYRIFDFGRRFPEGLDWKTQNINGVWIGFDGKTMSLSSPQRSEDDSLKNVHASGVARTICTQPDAIKWHADQLVAAMKLFGFDGFRYDDPLDYDAAQVDILGRRAPFDDWSTAAIIAYFRQRMATVKPNALLGHNSDPMRTSADSTWVKYQDDPTFLDTLESAILGQNRFALQEGWSNNLINSKTVTWAQWRDHNLIAGRAAHRNGGQVVVITNMGGEGEPQVKRATVTGLLLAAGNHFAYTRAGWRPYLALATRYSELIYGPDLRWLSAEEAAKTVQVDSGGRPIWWQDWVRVLPTAAGHRTYLVHLINPPVGDTVNNSTAPEPLQKVKVTLNLPPGWTAAHAWVLTAEAGQSLVQTIISSGTRLRDKEEEPYLDRSFSDEGQPAGEALPLAGSTVTVPEVGCWDLVAVECNGPAADVLPSDINPAAPAPVIPPLDAPIVAAKAPGVELAYFTRFELHQQNAGLPLSPDGQGVVLNAPLTVHVSKIYGLDWGWLRPIPTGVYRVSLRCRAPQALTGDLTLTCATGANAPAQNKFPVFPPLTGTHTWALQDVPTDHAGTLTTDMTWTEMPNDAVLTLTSTAPGVQVEALTVQCLQILDTQRLAVWKNGWPAGATLQAHPGAKVWMGAGLYYDYFHLDEAVKTLPGAQVDYGYYWKVGQSPCGFNETPFPSAETLPQYDLLIIADVDMLPFSPSQLDQLRGWVEAGGRLIMTGGPYGFGCGEWHLSDLLAPVYPAVMSGYFDLQPVGVPTPVHLQPADWLAKRLNWKNPPVVLWQHLMNAKPDAVVWVTAGGNPVIITDHYGKGKVCFIAAAPLGDAPAGQTAFWDWPQWPALMTDLVQDLMKR